MSVPLTLIQRVAERSSPAVSPLPEPGRRSMGEFLRPTRVHTLLVSRLHAPLHRPRSGGPCPHQRSVVWVAAHPMRPLPIQTLA